MATIWDLLSTEGAKFGVDPHYLLPIVYTESRGIPTKVNPSSGATGLFQLLPGVFPGTAGKTQQQLEDPTLNTDLALAQFAPAYHQGQAKGLKGTDLLDYAASHSGWPTTTGNEPPDYAKQINDVFNADAGGSGGGPDLGGFLNWVHGNPLPAPFGQGPTGIDITGGSPTLAYGPKTGLPFGLDAIGNFFDFFKNIVSWVVDHPGETLIAFGALIVFLAAARGMFSGQSITVQAPAAQSRSHV